MLSPPVIPGGCEGAPDASKIEEAPIGHACGACVAGTSELNEIGCGEMEDLGAAPQNSIDVEVLTGEDVSGAILEMSTENVYSPDIGL